jgi:mediator of RNA polymerase II transcription subunit 5
MDMELDTRGDSREQPAAGMASATAKNTEEWTRFLSQCIAKRLDPDRFASFVTILASRHPVPAPVLADIFLRPHHANHESLDPRVPRYLQILSEKQLIDTPAVLRALYKYSTSQTQAEAAGEANVVDVDDKRTLRPALRWKSSYGSEETIFYRLTKAVGMGLGIRTAGEALEVCKIMAKWMNLFTSASAAFAQDVMGQLHSTQSRDDMEASRAAFVMFLLSICENPVVLEALRRSFAKGEFYRCQRFSTTCSY